MARRDFETLEPMILMSATSVESDVDVSPVHANESIQIFAYGHEGGEQFEVEVDGQVLGQFTVGTSSQEFSIGLPEGVDPEKVCIYFINDEYDPDNGIDRNLVVDKIIVKGKTFETEASTTYSTGTWTPDGIVPGYHESDTLHIGGYFRFDVSEPSSGGSLSVFAYGDEGGEEFEVQIDGQTIGTFTVGTTLQEYSIDLPEGTDPSKVRIVFTNDLYDADAGIDRNLHVDRIVVNGETHQTEDPSTFSNGTWVPGQGVVPGYHETETLHSGGYFEFNLDGSGGGASNGNISVFAYGSEGGEQFEVQVEGQTLGQFTVGTSLQEYSVEIPEGLDPSKVRIVFTNDLWDPVNGTDRNLHVDKIIVNGEVCETEHPSTFSNGTWVPGQGTVPGYHQAETLHSNGYFEFNHDAKDNSPPDAVDDTGSTTQDSTFIGNVLLNDSDLDNDTLTVVSNTEPLNGTVSIDLNGTFDYTPDPEFIGTDQFSYTISDGKGGTDTATVTIVVQPPSNRAPEADDDTASTNQGDPISGNVLGNDSDPDNDSLLVISNTDPINGTVTVNQDGSYTYTPNANFQGTDIFEYTITDGNGGTDTARVTIQVGPPGNNSPVADDDSGSGTNEETISGNVLHNDIDPDNDLLTTTLVTSPSNGTLVFNSDGTYTYTPDAGFVGTDTFDYEVSDGRGGIDTATVTLIVAEPDDPQNASIGDTVWLDENRNGIQDADEAGIEGVEVTLYDDTGNVIASDTTDANGNYLFDNLAEGEYQVGVAEDALGMWHMLTDQDALANGADGVDSDVDQVTGRTDTIALGRSENIRDVDIGYKHNCDFEVDVDVDPPINGTGTQNRFHFKHGVQTHNGIFSLTPEWKGDTLREPGQKFVGVDLSWVMNLMEDTFGDTNLTIKRADVAYVNYYNRDTTYFKIQIMDKSLSHEEATAYKAWLNSDEFPDEIYLGVVLQNSDGSFETKKVCISGLDPSYSSIAYLTPVAFDLNGDGEIGVTGETTSHEKDGVEIGETVRFDIDADGELETMEWFAGDGDGILIDNRDGNAANDMDGSRLFGDEGGKYANGYEKLALLDANADGQLTDGELDGLELWVDDGDAVVEEGELKTLAELGIANISTQMTIVQDADGRDLMRGIAQTADGNTIMTEDVWFLMEEADDDDE